MNPSHNMGSNDVYLVLVGVSSQILNFCRKFKSFTAANLPFGFILICNLFKYIVVISFFSQIFYNGIYR